MYDLDAIEAINVDQLVTPLDRILLRKGNVRRTRRSFDMTQQAALAVAASKKRRDDEAAEKTLYMRAQRSSRVMSRISVVAAAACVTWLSVAAVCLLA